MNHCAIARENEGNPKWSQEHLDACYAAFVDGYAADIIRLSTREQRRRAIEALPEKFREKVRAKVLERWEAKK